MSLDPKQAVRIAQEVRERLSQRRRERVAEFCLRTDALLAGTARLQAQRDRLRTCLSKGWDTAAACARDAAEAAACEILAQADALRFAGKGCRAPVPPLRAVFGEIQQAEREFGALRWDRRTRELSADTDPVELEGVYLGPFRIRLSLARLGRARPDDACSVEALDPRPAASNDGVVHPHVSDGRLCAGDAAAAIQAALGEGRVCDFFLLVRSVLGTYNPDSPFVSLEEWGGASCFECGRGIPRDDARWCPLCDESYCEECFACCDRCGEAACVQCLARCPECEDFACPNCLVRCPRCGRRLCETCSEDELCPCFEEEPEHDEQQEQPSEREGSQPAQREGSQAPAGREEAVAPASG